MSKLKAWAQRPERTPTRIRKGDSVLVIAGKDRGKTGKGLEILAGKNRAKGLWKKKPQSICRI